MFAFRKYYDAEWLVTELTQVASPFQHQRMIHWPFLKLEWLFVTACVRERESMQYMSTNPRLPLPGCFSRTVEHSQIFSLIVRSSVADFI